jgi:hypothetical protein
MDKVLAPMLAGISITSTSYFGLHAFGGRGVGRYGAGQLSDLAIMADGTPNPIKNGQGLATLEWHGKKLDVYSYVGAEYRRTYNRLRCCYQ